MKNTGNSNKTIQYWNKSECLEFLRNFDAFEHKYLFKSEVMKSDASTDGSKSAAWCPSQKEFWNSILNSQNHRFSSHNLTYEEEEAAALGIKQVYCDEKHYTNEYLEMISIVRDKFIYDYTGIEGLCDFFSSAYFEYEWGMHLEINYEIHQSRFYRDHYVHQIRNMFEMFTLLDDFGYYQKCLDTYKNPENKIGTQIFESINQEILSMNCTDKELYGKILVLNNIEGIANSLPDLSFLYRYQKLNHSINERNIICKKAYKSDEEWENYFSTQNPYFQISGNSLQQITEAHRNELVELMFHYIIYTATIIASIVHDIGYPISYIRRIGGRLNDYLSISKLLANVNVDYSKIEQTLHESLLFKTIRPDVIRKRLDDSEEHGAQSAIMLLMYFHMYGENLTALQRCAIELAALVIYNHTSIFEICDGKRTPEIIRSDIHKEPLSHIFRICDDLQEWDRVYFEVTDKSNIFVCKKCSTPLLRDYATDIRTPIEKRYRCCCKNNCKNHYYDTSSFVNRRIINVIACESVTVKSMTNQMPDSADITEFKIDFDCGNLLNTLVFNTSFGKVRAKNIFELKRLCAYQGAFDTVLIDAFVSSNPFVVKIKILEKYYENILKIESNKIFWNDLYGDGNEGSALKKLSDAIMINGRHSVITAIWNKNIGFYCWLIQEGKAFKDSCRKEMEKLANGTNDLEKAEIIDNELMKEFIKLNVNTTNKDCLDAYKKFYRKLLKNIKAAAYSKIDNNNLFKKYINGNQDIRALCCDYLVQQVHILGYEKVRSYLTHNSSNFNTDAIRLSIVYRMLYERLYYTNNDISYYADEHVSRDDYDYVKKICREYTRYSHKGSKPFISPDEYINNRYKYIDFYVDYGLFIKLWNEVKECSKFYFDVYGVDNEYRICRFDTPELKKGEISPINSFPAKPNPNDSIVLECVTQSGEFRDEYEFDVLTQKSGRLRKSGRLTICLRLETTKREAEINYEDGFALSDRQKSTVKKLLENLSRHHNAKLVESSKPI